ncbi:MAG TPA: hypothetical protein VF384_00370 [Planctomycetota bacterium]
MRGTDMDDNDPEAISNLHAHIADVRDTIARHARSNRKRQRVVFGAGAVFAALIAVGMSAVIRLTDQLDAQTVAQLGRIEVERHLPDARAALETHLRKEAPKLVRDGMQSMLGLMPRLRLLLIQDVNQRFDAANDKFKTETLAQMADVVHATKLQIDAEWPNASDVEKLEKLVVTVADDYKTNVAALSEELYPAYEAEMSRITAFLDDLARKNPAELSNEDRMRRETIEITLQLIERGRAPTEAAFLSGEVTTPLFVQQAIENLTNNTSRTPDPQPEAGQAANTNGAALARRNPRK